MQHTAYVTLTRKKGRVVAEKKKKKTGSSKDTSSDDSKKTDESKGHVIDVSRPGSAKPSATSRPVIVGSGKIMQDPMVKSSSSTDKGEDSDKKDDEAKITTGSGRTIQPLSDIIKPAETSEEPKKKEEDAADTKDDEKTEADEQSPTPDKTDDTPTEEASKAEDDKSGDSSSDDDEPKKDDDDDSGAESAIVDAVVDQAANKKNTTKQEAETTDEHIQSLIEQKKYFVTVGKARKRRFDAIVITLSILAIIATVVVVANEYEYINLW